MAAPLGVGLAITLVVERAARLRVAPAVPLWVVLAIPLQPVPVLRLMGVVYAEEKLTE